MSTLSFEEEFKKYINKISSMKLFLEEMNIKEEEEKKEKIIYLMIKNHIIRNCPQYQPQISNMINCKEDEQGNIYVINKYIPAQANINISFCEVLKFYYTAEKGVWNEITTLTTTLTTTL